jgi:hypothetical protein
VSEVQAQPLILASIFLVAFFYMVLLALSPTRRTWAVKVGITSQLALASIFVGLGFSGITNWRAEAVAWMVREFPFTVLLSLVCLAQAGLLPARLGVAPLEEAAKRPRLQAVLAKAPLVLLSSWFAAGVLGMIWPAPVLQAFAPAPLHFLIIKWSLTLPTIFYCAVPGWLFLKAAGPRAPSPRLRLKNFLFSVGTFAWMVMTLNATFQAGLRVWAPSGVRVAVTAVLENVQSALLAVSALAFLLGVTLRHAPSIDEPLLRRISFGLLRAQDRFESHRWHLIKGGKVRRTIRISYHMSEAARRLELPEDDLQKALKTVELAAILEDPANRTKEITPEKARKLHGLQEESTQARILASRIRWERDWASARHENIASDSLRDALGAALELTGHQVCNRTHAEPASLRPLWYHLAAVAADDMGWFDKIHTEYGPEDRNARRSVLQAYEVAKRSTNLLTAGGG